MGAVNTCSFLMIDTHLVLPVATRVLNRNRKNGVGLVLEVYTNLCALSSVRAVLAQRGTVLDIVSNLDNS